MILIKNSEHEIGLNHYLLTVVGSMNVTKLITRYPTIPLFLHELQMSFVIFCNTFGSTES